MSNFSLRFFYEFFFEICLCVMINVATTGNGSAFLYGFSILLAIAILAFVAFLFMLFCRYGPYTVPKSYELNSLRKSWWGARHLCAEDLSTLQNMKTDSNLPDTA